MQNNITNNWVFDKSDGRWISLSERYKKSDFESIKVDFSSFRFYQKCLSGSVWSSPKSNIIDGGIEDIYNSDNRDYNSTLESHFNPNKLINGLKIEEVDLCSDIRIDISSSNIEVIDGVGLVNGHKVLLKNQFSVETLTDDIDPSTYFNSKFELISEIGNLKTYRYLNSENGIYIFNSGSLTKIGYDFDKIKVNLGDVNIDKWFKLDSGLNGVRPGEIDNKSYSETSNYIIRNKFDYNNVFDLDLRDFLKIDDMSIVFGEFGQIILTKFDLTTIINNDYREKISSVVDFGDSIFTCGSSGRVLKINKIDFKPESIGGFTNNNLNSIDFKNNLGVVVGDFNNIWITEDSGNTFKSLSFKNFDYVNWNSVKIIDINSFIVCGTTGNFFIFRKELDRWISTKYRFFNKVLEDIDSWEEIVDSLSSLVIVGDKSYSLSNRGLIIEFNISNSSFKLLKTDIVGNDFKSMDILTGDIILSNESGIFRTELNFDNQDTINLYSLLSTNLLEFGGVNKIKFIDGDIWWSGLSTKFNKLDPNESLFDSNFLDRVKSKLVFLDYDIASKLYWFDDLSQYRLPNRLRFGSTPSNIRFESLSDERSWIDYYRDRNKTFEYNTSLTQSSLVYPSFNFTYSSDWGEYKTFSSFIGLYPDLMPTKPEESNYRESGDIIINGIDSGVYLYDDIGVLITDDESGDIESGDILFLESDNITGSFVINKVISTQSIAGGECFADIYISSSEFSKLQSNNFIFDQVSMTFSVLVSGVTSSEIGISGSNIEFYDIINSASELFEEIPGISLENITTIGSDIWKVSLKSSINLNGIYPQILASGTWQIGTGGDSITELGNPQPFTGYSESLIYKNHCWFYTNFNEGILNDLIGKEIKVSNLNKYNNDTFIDKLSKHPISLSYDIDIFDEKLEIIGKYSNESAYYNLATNVIIDSNVYEMVYPEEFIKFGFTPTYNLFNYLKNIDDVIFDNNKVFNNFIGLTQSDFTLNKNTIILDDIEPFDDIVKWTFYDIVIDEDSQKNLLIDKNIIGGKLYLYFYDGINVSGNLLELYPRNKLIEISEDLEYLSQLNRNYQKLNTSYNGDDKLGTWIDLESKFNRKYPTDGYAKILLGDKDFIDIITGIIFTDSNNNLRSHLINLSEKYLYSDLVYNKSGLTYSVNISNNDMSIGDNFLIKDLGVMIVSNISGNTIQFKSDLDITSGDIEYLKFDPKLGFKAIGLSKFTKSGMDIPIRISDRSISIIGSKYNLIDLDLNDKIFELRDGLDYKTLSFKYPWLSEAEITDALIGEDLNGPIFYRGVWECGRWFGGTWLSGEWLSGDWYGGTWKDSGSSKWYVGRWFDGTWESGEWFSGRWYGGTWKGGTWLSGIWNLGTWESGDWLSGIWVDGSWNGGKFSSKFKESIWISGEFRGGQFLNGLWLSGTLNNATFGSESSKSRKSIWKGGKFISGEFKSGVLLDYYKNSIFESGSFINSKFSGGSIKSSNFNNSIFESGIVDFLNIDIVDDIKFSIVGEWMFNIKDTITLVSDYINEDYHNYIIVNNFYNKTENKTYITVSEKLKDETILVSNFKNSKFLSGIWKGGIFIGGDFSGLWYDGVFSGNFGI